VTHITKISELFCFEGLPFGEPFAILISEGEARAEPLESKKMAMIGKDSKGLMIEIRWDSKKDLYMLQRRHENYSAHHRGGIKYTWKNIKTGLTRREALDLFNKMNIIE